MDPGQTIFVEASSIGLESDIVMMELFVDDASVLQVDSARIVYDLELTETGTRTVRAVAEDENKNRAEAFFTIPGPKMIWQFGELQCRLVGQRHLSDPPAGR